jgi:hypothetical protein
MHRIYAPRVVADHLMMQDDFVRLHKFLLEMGDLSGVSDDLRKLIEDEWPELTHKLLPKNPNAWPAPARHPAAAAIRRVRKLAATPAVVTGFSAQELRNFFRHAVCSDATGIRVFIAAGKSGVPEVRLRE